jgi:hypothetical protein
MLYLEAPAGVGFSYSPVAKEEVTGDNQTAADNLVALNAFFARFPEYAGVDFYVSGESYGGVYVPTLSQKIYAAAQAGAFGGSMKGYLVGNGVFDYAEAAPTHAAFAYGHGFISTALNAQIVSECVDYAHPSAKCKLLLDKLQTFSPATNGYDAYRTCYHPSSGGRSGLPLGDLIARVAEGGTAQRAAIGKWARAVRESVPCINSVKGTAYLNRKDVKEALHVASSPNDWAVCGGVDYRDDGVFDSMVAIHQAMAKFKPRVLVYNGGVVA